MVKTTVISSAQPSYDLADVHAAVAANNVIFRGNSTRDRDNLGYTPEEASRCLHKLTPSNFRRSETYQGESFIADVYQMRHEHEGCIDQLYIKLTLATPDCLILSFHRDR